MVSIHKESYITSQTFNSCAIRTLYFVFIILVNPIPSPTQGYSLATSNGFFPVALQTLTACGRWCDSKIIKSTL